MNNSNTANTTAHTTALTKEQIHDQKISPLVNQIIAICKENNINSLLSFSLDDDLMCTSFIPADKEDEGLRRFAEAAHIIRSGTVTFGFMAGLVR